MNRIEAEADAAARNRNGQGNGHRPPARGLLPAAAAVMGQLFDNPLIARLDAEGLGHALSDADRDAVLHLVRSLETRPGLQLPHRQPALTGPQPAQERL